jgi:parallel beta-helix repeat protein
MKNVLIASLLITILLTTTACAAPTDTDINKLIQSAKVGSTVTLQKTTYNINNPIVLKSGVNINGNGATLLLKPYTKWSEWTPVIHGRVVKNVHITNLNLYMNRDKQTAPRGRGYHIGMFFEGGSNIEVDHCSIANGLGDGIRSKSSENLKIHDNTVKHIGHDGIFVVDCKYVDIWNNKVTTNTNAGIREWNTVFLKIRSNTIDSELNGYGGYGAMQIEYSKFYSEPSVVISDNIMRKTWGPGIILFGYDKGVGITKGIIINRNRFLECGYSHSIQDTGGISIQGLKGIVIQNNVADGCYNTFIYLAKGGVGTIVKNNIITSTQSHRIVILRRAQNPIGSGYGISNIAGARIIVDSNCFFKNINGNVYRIASKNDDLKDPKTHKTSSGWIWKNGGWA